MPRSCQLVTMGVHLLGVLKDHTEGLRAADLRPCHTLSAVSQRMVSARSVAPYYIWAARRFIPEPHDTTCMTSDVTYRCFRRCFIRSLPRTRAARAIDKDGSGSGKLGALDWKLNIV